MEIYPVEMTEQDGIIIPASMASMAPTKFDESNEEVFMDILRSSVGWKSGKGIKVRVFTSAAPHDNSHTFITPQLGPAMWHQISRIERMFPMRSCEVLMRF